MSVNLFQTLLEQQIPVQEQPAITPHQHVNIYYIDSMHWQNLLTLAQQTQCRFAAIWAQQFTQPIDIFRITLCLEENNNYLLFNTDVITKLAKLPTCTNNFPAANRFERHIRDLYGITFTNSNDTRRWTRHKAWRDSEFPLNKNYQPRSTAKNITSTPANCEYHFNSVEGSGVCEIPVGPVHAGIIEPGHFRFSVSGENILRLEERLGYVHKGIEKIAENRNIEALLRLAARVSGDSTVSHSWALCRACEDPQKITVPLRAQFLRAIMAERERIANHIGDIGALCNDVGFAFAYYQMTRLRELWQRISQSVFGHRFMMDQIIYGGVHHDITAQHSEIMLQQITAFKKELSELFSIIDNNNSLQDRFVTTGILQPQIAKKLGVLGYVGKASGQNFDVRSNIPYSPYDQLDIDIPCFDDGDVAARFNIRAQEIFISFKIIETLLKTMPQGKINLDVDSNASLANSEGFGYVEGWRGEILVYVRFNEKGTVERYFPRDPSWLNWPALEQLVNNNIVPDFPVCNKSVNASYSGQDL